ncbi:hypothetical protein DA803_02330 [[Mycoplasma] phocae]|uniref:Lipoprotein n=1 Tax=[Mycoplasma] phocae TaxID=142651 RepID=A0A2Z5IQC0_9BACT|nr:hypothetical protein [[Mycoplasma] phocae]AXE60919.1 hypothetical protein DA803_02330 [[Mycoplasma] phocae]
MKNILNKKKLYISLGAIATVTVPIVVTSCSFSENLRYQFFNFAKKKILDMVGEVENYFKDDRDPDIEIFKDRLKAIVAEVKKTVISSDNTPEQFVNKYENEANDLFDLYAKIKKEKIRAIIDLYVSRTKASTLLNAISTFPNYKETADKLQATQSQIPDVDISTPKIKIEEYIAVSNNSLKEAKFAIEEISNKFEIDASSILKLV